MPVDAPGVTIVSRPAGRPGEKVEHGGAVLAQVRAVDRRRAVRPRVRAVGARVLRGRVGAQRHLTYSYATHHRQSCIGARAGFGDLLIGAGALMCEANGLDPGADAEPARADGRADQDRRGLLACGVAASVYGTPDEHSGTFMPEPVFANIGKLLLATQIYEMQRLAHYVSGGLVVACPARRGPQPRDRGDAGRRCSPAAPYPVRQAHRGRPASIEDLTASYSGGWYSLISLHGGGSPEAMKREIFRQYPLEEKAALVERLLDRGAMNTGRPVRERQPGRCCVVGCATDSGTTPGPTQTAPPAHTRLPLATGTRPRLSATSGPRKSPGHRVELSLRRRRPARRCARPGRAP